jgi:hypothetical protein
MDELWPMLSEHWTSLQDPTTTILTAPFLNESNQRVTTTASLIGTR